MAVYIDDSDEPIAVCRILEIFKPGAEVGVGGTWAHVRWWKHTGYKDYPNGCFKEGVDRTSDDNIPLTSGGGLDGVNMVHWAHPTSQYPVLTKRGNMSGHVKRLVRRDIRFQDLDKIKDIFS